MYVIDSPDTPPGEPGRHHVGDERAHRVADRIHRSVLATVQAAQRDTETQLQRADTKATCLVGLFGAVLAGALTLAHLTHGLAMVLTAAAVLPLGAAVLVLLLVLWARPGRDHGIARWALFAQHPAALVEELSLPARHALPRQAARLSELAALAVVKYRRVNAAIALLAVGLVLLTLAALAA